MSLRHALLAVLDVEPMTGYELLKYFDGSVAFLWSAPHSQIYPELRRMEAARLVQAKVVPRGQRAEKRVYSITAKGGTELRRWLSEVVPPAPDRDAFRLKASYFDCASADSVRQQLQLHLAHWSRRVDDWNQLLEDIGARRVPLLQLRLAQRPTEEHDAIVAFKLFAYRGEVGRGNAEIEWAKDGLRLLDELESDQRARESNEDDVRPQRPARRRRGTATQ